MWRAEQRGRGGRWEAVGIVQVRESEGLADDCVRGNGLRNSLGVHAKGGFVHLSQSLGTSEHKGIFKIPLSGFPKMIP